jgi:hypothetical protein
VDITVVAKLLAYDRDEPLAASFREDFVACFDLKDLFCYVIIVEITEPSSRLNTHLLEGRTMMVSFHHRGPITEERFVLDRFDYRIE